MKFLIAVIFVVFAGVAQADVVQVGTTAKEDAVIVLVKKLEERDALIQELRNTSEALHLQVTLLSLKLDNANRELYAMRIKYQKIVSKQSTEYRAATIASIRSALKTLDKKLSTI